MSLTIAQLAALLEGSPPPESLHDHMIKEICHDSRLANPHVMYIPLPRTAGLWATFCMAAFEKGCRCFVLPWSYDADIPSDVKPYVWKVQSINDVLGPLYRAVYGPLPSVQVALTGTDGKSTTAHLLAQLWQANKTPWGMVGTLGTSSWPQLSQHVTVPAGMTTPPQPWLYDQLAQFAESGIDHCVFEVSSHALAQDRIHPLQVSIAVLTSFAQDHLDYHGNLFAYWRAKWRLMSHYLVRQGGQAIIHASIPIPPTDMATLSPDMRLWRYGEKSSYHMELDGHYTIHQTSIKGKHVTFELGNWSWTGMVPLLGAYNIDNLLAALIGFAAAGGDLQSIQDNLPSLTGPAGRLECIGSVNQASIFVDYAHTPQGLEHALQTLRPLTLGRLGVVFGCGGNRDATKRPVMGRIASSLADWVVVTDDNPRLEDPDQIRKEIMVGSPNASIKVDRSHAIGWSLNQLKPGDILLIAGKGHETEQIIGTHSFPHSDASCVRQHPSFELEK